MKRTLVAVALAVVFVMALATPALAQMTHTAAYEFDGVIDLEKQAGHKCNTGAAILQTIKGSGVMDKTQTVSMNTGKISMDDDNNWVAGATPLTVTTVWDLCAPAKHVYDETGEVLHVADVYEKDAGEEDGNFTDTPLANFDPISDQIWAVQVQADPGFSGNLSQVGVAAHGPYAGVTAVNGSATPNDIGDDEWGWEWNDDMTIVEAAVGEDFVGNYFSIEQHARTSQGTQRRYISLSSPFSHAYVMEDMSVVGKSDISDSLLMANLPAGGEVPGDWWNLF